MLGEQRIGQVPNRLDDLRLIDLSTVVTDCVGQVIHATPHHEVERILGQSHGDTKDLGETVNDRHAETIAMATRPPQPCRS